MMAYPDPNTAEWWDLVASGYRQLAESPPKFLAPGSTIEGFREKAEEAEMRANKVRRIEIAEPISAAPPKMAGCGQGYAIKQLLMRQSLPEVEEVYREPVKVTEDLWNTVLGLGE